MYYFLVKTVFANLIMQELYQDQYVWILHPDDPVGIKVVHFSQSKDILTEGLKTGVQLRKEGKEFGRGVYHPYSFFRAPPYKT
jgi:hypothetical protein